MQEWTGLIALFLIASALSYVVLRFLDRRRTRLQTRLNPEGIESESEHLQHWLAPQPHTTSAAAMQPELHDELRTAGFYSPAAPQVYQAIRTILILGVLLATGYLCLLVPRTNMVAILLGGMVCAMMAYSLPRVYLSWRGKARSHQIERGLPVAIDLLTLSLSSGENVHMALHRTAQELHNSHPVFAGELEITHQHTELGGLEHALQQLADRSKVPEVRNLALLLAQAERLGTEVSTALLEFATSFRTTLRQRAEGHANRASFWMLLPTVFCMWVAAAIILIGPAYLDFWTLRSEATQLLQDATRNVQEIAAPPR